MGKRGPKPKPVKERELHGNPSRRPLPKRNPAKPIETVVSPLPPPVGPERPGHLLPAAAELWDRLVPLLTASGKLTSGDEIALAAYCQSYARYLLADEWLTANGTVATLRNDKGEVKAMMPVPQFGIMIKLLDKIRQLGNDFGLSPSARGAGVGAAPALEPEKKTLTDFARKAKK